MSSSTATFTVLSATPHLRAVRSVPSPAPSAGRWRTSTPARPGPGLLEGLSEGNAVVAALPQSALSPLLSHYSGELGATTAAALVGYLVLVPAEQGQQPAGPALVPAPATTASLPQVQPSAHGISVDTDRRNAYVDGELLDLTYLEFELLAHLTAHPHRVHTRDHLVTAVWGYGHVGDGRTVDVHVARLRRKLGPAYRDSIVTVRRVGYKYAPAG